MKKYKGYEDKYECTGYFYKIYDGNIELAQCRSVLDIRLIDSKEISRPEALFIMMNPGTSIPLEEKINTNHVMIDNFEIKFNQADMVKAKPDDTQFRLMDIMEYKKWKYVRVINLSDIRQPKGKRAIQEIKTFENISLSMLHSIFSPQRDKELIEVLKVKQGAPIIGAWGAEDYLEIYANRCLKKVGDNIIRVTDKTNSFKCSHPLTTKLSWISEIKKLI